MSDGVVPLSLKDAPALIERLLPVQRLSAEAYKEQMAGSGKTLTPLGSYWKGRKPLILNKGCILGCLLPATDNAALDLAIFEKLMAMDDESFVIRLGRRESEMLTKNSYRERVSQARRPEEIGDAVHAHIWDSVNHHLGTHAQSFPELVAQLGIMRFGHRPRVADTFCGSGQIPFEAARLGCDVYASDLNPVASMLTWGALNIIGGSRDSREELGKLQEATVHRVQTAIDDLGVEVDGKGWRAKVFLYCVEVRCPQTGWLVPLIPSLVISKPRTGAKINVIAELVPDAAGRRYDIAVRTGVSDEDVTLAERGTVRSDGRGQDPYLVHTVDGTEYRTKISTLRGDYRQADGSNANRLRLWDKQDFRPRSDDIFLERLYAIQWLRADGRRRGGGYEFRSVTSDDLRRERVVEDFIGERIADWQAKGWIPDMRIEAGYNTDQPIRERGWTHWHHLFNPRQLLVAGLVNQFDDARLAFGVAQLVNWNSRLCRWNIASGGGGSVQDTFYNQALNTLLNYACRGFAICPDLLRIGGRRVPLDRHMTAVTTNLAVADLEEAADIFITDPPYGDAINYDEILDFFIAWLRKNPPAEFAEWIWDSRKSLAIKGVDEGFRRSMVAGYKRMTEQMPNNGIQVIMFTHQSGSLWADMANIVWASGLHVTAAWYVVTETDSPLRDGTYVKGTVVLVLRKRGGADKTTRGDLAWEIKEEVESQVQSLTGLNQDAKGLYRDENVFEDADIQMAGYAAALRVLTRYATIDGRDMVTESIRPRVRGETTFVDGLIAFAVDTANQCLVPEGFGKALWDNLSGAERFYLKMLDLETRGVKSLDNYQNFAKAFKVRDFRALMGDQRANSARLKTATEFGRGEMNEASQLHESVMRAVLYSMMELHKNMDGADVLSHLTLNVPDYYNDSSQREIALEIVQYIAKRTVATRPEEAATARVLTELIKNHRLG